MSDYTDTEEPETDPILTGSSAILAAPPHYPVGGYYREDEAAGRFVRDVDQNEQRVPFLPYEVMIDPSGNVCSFPISTNRCPELVDEGYQKLRKRMALKKGWREVHAHEVKTEVGADGIIRARIVSKELLADIVKRRAKSAKEAKKYAGVGVNDLTKLNEALKQFGGDLVKAVEVVNRDKKSKKGADE